MTGELISVGETDVDLDSSFVANLRRLVALDTASPMETPQLAACAAELARYGCRSVGGEIFGYGRETAPVWLYSHVDTKPADPRDQWTADPLQLTYRSGFWFGLGVSDAKFQLLNALRAADPREHFVLVDTCEESNGNGAAAAYLAEHHPRVLVICDGAREDAEIYRGCCGQADGYIHLTTGTATRHPARPGPDVSNLLRSLLAAAAAATFKFTLTGLSAPETTRSLATQEAYVRFDIRFEPIEEAAVRAFLGGWPHEIRQWIWPVAATGLLEAKGLRCDRMASFSNRLGAQRPMYLEHVLVVPGGDPDNRNHEPDEFIRPGQVGHHLRVLRRVLGLTKEILR